MRKAARIAGLAWLTLMAVAGAFLWAAETMVWISPISSNRGLIYIVFVACLPGVLLYRWGRGPYRRPDPVRDILERAYPTTSGNVMHMKKGPPHAPTP
jgi:hypothetical protein